MGLALAISIMINLHILPIPLSCHAMHPSSRRLPQSVVQLTNVLTLSSSSYSDEGDDSITLWRGILHEWVSKCMSRKKIANSKKQSRRGSMGSWGWIPSLSYMEEKLETTKSLVTIWTKGLLVKFPLNTHIQSDHPSRKNTSLHAQICTEYCTKAFGGWAPHAQSRWGSLQHSLRRSDPLARLKGKGEEEKGGERRGKGGERKGRRKAEGQYPPPVIFSGYDQSHVFSAIFSYVYYTYFTVRNKIRIIRTVALWQ